MDWLREVLATLQHWWNDISALDLIAMLCAAPLLVLGGVGIWAGWKRTVSLFRIVGDVACAAVCGWILFHYVLIADHPVILGILGVPALFSLWFRTWEHVAVHNRNIVRRQRLWISTILAGELMIGAMLGISLTECISQVYLVGVARKGSVISLVISIATMVLALYLVRKTSRLDDGIKSGPARRTFGSIIEELMETVDPEQLVLFHTELMRVDINPLGKVKEQVNKLSSETFAKLWVAVLQLDYPKTEQELEEDREREEQREQRQRAAQARVDRAEQGDAEAQYALGTEFLECGEDFQEAASWLRKAAEQGHAEAQSVLGSLYYKGKGVPKDLVVAYMWANLAAAQGVAEAVEGREKLEQMMTKMQLRQAQRMCREHASR